VFSVEPASQQQLVELLTHVTDAFVRHTQGRGGKLEGMLALVGEVLS
jgi:hypothetical protein